MQPEHDTATDAPSYETAARDFRALLETIPFKMECVSVPNRPNGDDWDKRAAHVQFALTSPRLRSPLVSHYSAGIGAWLPKVSKDWEARQAERFDGKRWMDKAMYQTLVERLRRKWAPDPADVLESLIRDAQGADQPFEDWAADLGYDTDSRKAERIHDQCRMLARAMRALFGADFERACDLVNEM